MIIHFLDASKVGGIETHVETLALAQAAAGHTTAVLLWNRYPGSTAVARFERSGLRLLCAGGSLRRLQRILAAEKPDMVHTHGYKAGILGRLAAKAKGLPIVSTFHAGERAAFPVNLYQTLDEWSSCFGGRIAVSKPIAESLPYKAELVSNFVAFPMDPPQPADPRAISFAGRLSEEKAPDLFCAIARAIGADARFSIFGEGPMEAGLRQVHAGDVAFNGFAADMDNVWRRTGLLLMPSRREGLPMAALEAMARGIPVAASATGALPDLIEDGVNGFLFAAGDVQGGMAAVRRWLALGERDRRAMAAATRLTIARNYSVEAGVQKVMAIYARNGWLKPKPAAPATSSHLRDGSL